MALGKPAAAEDRPEAEEPTAAGYLATAILIKVRKRCPVRHLVAGHGQFLEQFVLAHRVAVSVAAEVAARDLLAKNANLCRRDRFGGRVPYSSMSNCLREKAQGTPARTGFLYPCGLLSF